MYKSHLFTAVWGPKFTEFFCRYTLPTLLTKNNIEFLSINSNLTFTIVTDTQSANFLQSFKEFASLSQRAEVKIIETKNIEIDRHSHWKLWHDAIESNPDNSFHAAIIPDCIYRDGILSDIFERLWSGTDLVYYPLPQVSEECIIENFQDGLSLSGLSSQQIAELWIDYLNPKHAAAFEAAPFWLAHPEYSIVARSGNIYLSELAGHALALNSNTPSVSYHFNALSPSVKIQAIDIGGVSCEPMMKFVEQYEEFPKITNKRIHYNTMGAWAAYFREGYFRNYSHKVHHINYEKAGKKLSAKWPTLKLKYTEGLVTYAAILNKIWREVQNFDPDFASILFSKLLIDPHFFRNFRNFGNCTIFFPQTDQQCSSIFDHVLGQSNFFFRDIVRMHVVENFVDVSPDSLFVLTGKAGDDFGKLIFGTSNIDKLSVNAALVGRVISRPLRIDECINLVFYSTVDYKFAGQGISRTEIGER